MKLLPIGADSKTVEVVQQLMGNLSPVALELMMENNMSLWGDYLHEGDRIRYRDAAKAHHEVIQQIDTEKVMDILSLSRPDIYAYLSRDGGKVWLHRQVLEIKQALLWQ